MDPTPNQYPTDNGRNHPYTPPCARAIRYRPPQPTPQPTPPPTKGQRTYRLKTTAPPPTLTTTPNTLIPNTALTSAHLDAIAAATELGMRPATARTFALEVLTLTDIGLILRHILNRRIS